MAFGVATGVVGCVWKRRSYWWRCRASKLAVHGGGAPRIMLRRVVGLGVACGLFGPTLVVLKTGFDGFFRYEANGMGGESQKCSLRVRLALFQILENQGSSGLFGADFWYI